MLKQIDFFEKLFYPKTLAFIGANPRRIWHLGGYINRFPRDSLYIVSNYYDKLVENHEEFLNGVTIYRDISEIPDEIDHSVISVSRNRLIETIKECLEKKFYTIHVFSAGTGEFDEKGFEIESELYELFKNNENSRLVGPNCMGIYSPRGKFSYSGRFSETAGNFALVSQSGDLTNRIVGSLNARGVYLSFAASVGNSISLRSSDLIDFYNRDQNTDVILSYMEGFSQFRKSEFEGRIFFDSLKKIRKPLFLLKGGMSELGKRAASSHTGSLASQDAIWNSIFKQTNAIPVASLDELLDTAVLFRFCSNCEPKHNSILMITWSGGSSVLGVDSIARLNAGIDVPIIQEPTNSKMKELIRVGSITNPLDLPDVRDDNIRFELFKLAVSEDYISGAIRLSSGPKWRGMDQDEEAVKKFYADLLRYKEICDKLGKPFMLTTPSSNDADFRKKLIEMEIPAFASFSRAAKAFSNLYRYKNQKRQS
ncbi:MAG: CoA-binding protein [Candidatus Hodarchaeales archaeon]|jgi:acyl-CoA synthetase (NDP forming)